MKSHVCVFVMGQGKDLFLEASKETDLRAYTIVVVYQFILYVEGVPTLITYVHFLISCLILV